MHVHPRSLQRGLQAVAISLMVSSASGQKALLFLEGPASSSHCGYSVAGAGDTNADGIEDVIVGVPWDSINGAYSGSAAVYSGVDGQVLHVFVGEDPNDALGLDVSGGGDVNGDGHDDIVVGVPFDFAFDRGSVRVHSGRDGTLLYKFKGLSSEDWFGSSVATGGDVNGDGFADVVVGAPRTDNAGAGSGSAYVFSGATGILLYQFDGDSTLDQFGFSVAVAGDVNNDGFDDIIVGARSDGPGASRPGRAHVFSGIDGATLLTLEGAYPNGFFGHCVSGAGDVNGDGKADVIVGAWADGTNGQESGSARVFSGADGSVLHSFYGQANYADLGISVAAIGDLNGDARDDVLVGVLNGGYIGEVRAYSGADGAILHSFASGEVNDQFGWTCDGLRDLDGDGVNDVLVGAWQGTTSNGPDAGAAWVLTIQEQTGADYCGPANLNSSGKAAAIDAFGSRVSYLNDLRLQATDTDLDQFGMFVNSMTTGMVVPPGSQGILCLGGAIGRYKANIINTGTTGTMSLQLDLVNTPTPGGPVAIQPGETWYFQGWFRDENPGPTSNFTDGIRITFY